MNKRYLIFLWVIATASFANHSYPNANWMATIPAQDETRLVNLLQEILHGLCVSNRYQRNLIYQSRQQVN